MISKVIFIQCSEQFSKPYYFWVEFKQIHPSWIINPQLKNINLKMYNWFRSTQMIVLEE